MVAMTRGGDEDIEEDVEDEDGGVGVDGVDGVDDGDVGGLGVWKSSLEEVAEEAADNEVPEELMLDWVEGGEFIDLIR